MEITLNCVISEGTSYGITGIQIVRALTKLGHKVNCVPIGGRADYRSYPEVEKALQNGQSRFDIMAPSIRLYHQFSLMENCGRGPSIGFPIFELDNFTDLEISNLFSVNRLFVCSKWAQSVIKDRKISTPTDVVPLGVDGTVFYPREIKNQNTPFTFFFPGKFEYRKGFDVVTTAFERAFNANDNFQVLFLPNNPFISEGDAREWVRYLTSTKFGNKFKLVGRLESQDDVANLTRQADCVVSFSRAEGWNLPLLEALSCGVRVIATNYSGHTEFLNHDNATLIDCDGRELAFDGVFFNGAGSWLDFKDKDIDNMANALKSVYNDGPRINAAGIETASRFSWINSAEQIVSLLEV